MALKIKMGTENWDEIKSILHDFADHAKICEVCNVKTFAHCTTGGAILAQFSKFPECETVPEDWKPKA